MTVDEAKNKWCCTHEIEKCNADECMAWRWFDPAIKHDGYCGLAGKEGGGVMKHPILDPCCGSKMFWFNKDNPNVEFCDIRTVPYHEYYPHRYIEIKPDTICNFTALPFSDKTFKLVVFDPPHLTWAGPTSYMRLKY